MPVSVICQTHPFEDLRRVEFEAHDGANITRMLRQVHLPAGCRPAVTLNGYPVRPEFFDQVRGKDGDIVTVRATPAGGKAGGSWRTLAGLGLGAGAAALLWSLSRTKTSTGESEGSALEGNSFAPPPEPRLDPPLPPVTGLGGAKDRILPMITGLQNRKNNGGVFPVVYGTYKIYPVVVADPYILLQGNDQYLHVVLSCGYGELDISEIKIGQRPIAEYVAQGAQYEVRYGTLADADLTLYTKDVDTLNVNELLLHTVEKQKTAGQTADRLSVNFIFPDGLYYTVPDSDPETRITQSIHFNVYYRLAGSSDPWVQVPPGPGMPASYVATDNIQSAVRKALTWDVTRGLYEVKVVRASIAQTAENSPDTSYWESLQSIKNIKPNRAIKDSTGTVIPMTYIALRIKASELANGQLEELNCICKSKLKYYDGAAWQNAVISDNPAWVFTNMLTGGPNGNQIPLSQLSGAKLKEWADFCTLKGFKFNAVFDQAITLPQALREVCSAALASAACPDGRIGVIIEKARTTPVQMFTPANSSGLKWGKRFPTLPHALRVGFINPDAEWQMDYIMVYDDGYDEDSASQIETVEYIGVTNADQAWKLARYQLCAARNRLERYELDCDIQHLVCTRGDLVLLNYDITLHGLGYGVVTGTVVDGSNNQLGITIDNAVEMSAALNYGVRVRLADGTYHVGQISTVAGSPQSTVTWTIPIPAATNPKPARGDVFGFGYYGNEAAPMLIESIEHNFQDMSAHVTMVDYQPAIYNADSGPVPTYTPNVSIPHQSQVTVEQPIIDNIKSDESVLTRESDGSYTTRMLVSYRPPVSMLITTVQYQFKPTNAESWGPAFSTGVSTSLYVTGVQDLVSYDFRMRFMQTDGRQSAWTTTTHTVVGKTTKPPNVPNVSFINETLDAKYDASVGVTVPLDFSHLEWRGQLGDNQNYDSAFIIVEHGGSQIPAALIPPGIVTVMVKAVDVAGNKSETAAILLRDFGPSASDNQIITIEEHPTFDGTKTNCSVIGGELKADDLGSNFWTGNGTATFWSGNGANPFWASSYSDMMYEWSYTAGYELRKPFKFLLDWVITADQVTVEYKKRGSNLFWDASGAGGGNPFWRDNAALFWGGDDSWLIYPQGGIEGKYETIDFRVMSAASALSQTVVSELSTIVDVPDIIEYLADVVIDSAGTRLPIQQDYIHISDVILTLQNDPTYPDARSTEYLDRSIEGPLVQVYDAAHGGTQGKINAHIKGY